MTTILYTPASPYPGAATGDIIIWDSVTGSWIVLASNTTATRKFLKSVSTTTSLDTLQSGDIPDLSALYAALSAGKIAGSQVPYGSAVSTACQGNDSRLSDARTPTSHAHAEGDVTNLTSDLGGKAVGAGTTVTDNLVSFLDTAGKNLKDSGKKLADLVLTGDSRLSDARTPTAHNILSTSHGDALADFVLAGDLLFGNATPKWARLAKDTDGKFLKMVSGLPGWAAHGLTYSDVGAASTSDSRLSDSRTPTAHNLLSTPHGDTLADSVVLGDVLIGNATPKWARLAGNTTTTKKFLRSLGAGGLAQLPSFEQVDYADLSGVPGSFAPSAHQLNSATYHTVSELTAGHFVKALTSTTFGFAAHGLSYSDVGADASGAAATAQSNAIAAIATDTNLSAAMQALKTTPPTHGSAQHDSTVHTGQHFIAASQTTTFAAGSTTYSPLEYLNNRSGEAVVQSRMARAGTMSRLRVLINANATGTASTVTLRVNGVSQDLTVSIPAGSTTTITDDVNSVAVAANALVNWIIVAGSTGSLVLNLVEADYN